MQDGAFARDHETDQFPRPSAFVRGPEGKKVGQQLWAELSAKLEAIHPGVMDNV